MFEEINHDRRFFLASAAKAIAAAQLGLLGCAAQQSTSATDHLPVEGELPSLQGADEWLNSQPLTAKSLRGKVVLIDFCTYTCINWLRQLPFVRAWHEKYKDRGLAVIGVHTPEFEFEKNLANARRALRNLRVDYPIAVDNDYALWRAFNNRYWPALYFTDKQGRIRHHHFGEGEYEKSERIIQRLLNEDPAASIDRGIVAVAADGIEKQADWENLRSPETYLGFERTVNFASTGGLMPEKNHPYRSAERLGLNQWSLSGEWTVNKQHILLNKPNGRIANRFHARDLHLVMKPEVSGKTIRFRVTLDEEPPAAARGIDVDEQGFGAVAEQRLYQLIRQPKPVAERKFEIEFLDPGVEAFAFTFG